MWRKALLIGARVSPYLRKAAPAMLVLGVLGVLVLLVATWWLGPSWPMNGEYPLAAWQMRALVTLAVVLMVAMVWGLMLARRLRKVASADAEAQQEIEDPILPFERKQQRLLDRQLSALKANLPGRQGVYRLPWYLVMGLEEAGKTSLIQRSGQTYTLTNVTRNNRADHNPLGFDWWIGDHGVLIDPDGELLSQDPERGAGTELSQRLWQHFIGWLEANRPQRPLNGVVLSVDLAQLSVASDSERRAQAILLRTRLRELMERWGLRETTASSGREALEMLRAARRRGDPFDLAIVDQQMPGYSGDELIAAIRDEPAISAMALIMFSSIGSVPAPGRSPEKAADAFLTKPACGMELFETVANIVGATAERRSRREAENGWGPDVGPKTETEPPSLPDREVANDCDEETTILLVEDNAVNRLVMKEMLRPIGVTVIEAHDGADAVELADFYRPAVILMDLSMPVMDGFEATRRIRAAEAKSAPDRVAAKIVAMTAHAMQSDRVRCLEAGMDDFISKPVEPDQLLAMLRRLIGMKKAA